MISVATITLNNFKELKETLESLPKEEFIESIVINGGDNEETFEYLKNHTGKVINEKDSGIAEAFNKGIRNSSGDAIMFLNSGDLFIDSSYLKEAHEIFQNKPEIDFIHSNLLFKDLTGADLLMKPAFSSLGRGQPYLHPTMILRKKIFNEIGLFNTDYKISMDFDFIVRMEKKGYKGYYRNKGPVIVMEGKGKSAIDERDAIRECYKSLKENKVYNIQNRLGLSRRLLLYYTRKILISIGGKNTLKKLKEKKYSIRIF